MGDSSDAADGTGGVVTLDGLGESLSEAGQLPQSTFPFLPLLRHKIYRPFLFGQLVSQMGNWITNVAQGWLVYDLSHSPFLLGVTAFAGQIPVFFFSFLGGMIADRFERRRVLIITQTLSIVESAGLAALALTGTVRPWHIVALALFQGCVNAADIPTRQALLVEMVGRDEVRRAVSLNSMIFNLTRLIAPLIAGFIIATVGPGLCFVLDALSYGAVLSSLYWMRLEILSPQRPRYSGKEIISGFVYIWRAPELRNAMVLIAICAMFGGSYVSLLPAFTTDVLHRGSEGLGLLYAATGSGAFLGAYFLAHVPQRHLLITPILAATALGISLIGFSVSHWIVISLALLLCVSFNLMLIGGCTSTLVQIHTRDEMRGRVMALYAMSFMGMMPWGSLLLGWMGEHVAVGLAVMTGGAVCVLGSLSILFFSYSGR